MTIESILPFLKEVDRLKGVERQTLVHSGERRENSAEHSWHLAIAVMALHKMAPGPLDLFKAVRMALLHDLVEIDAGDVFVYDDQGSKKVKELAAIERLTALLPNGEDFKKDWLEFESGESPEAKFVSALDRFLPLYSNFLNQGHSWKNHGISSARVIAKNGPPIRAGLPPLWRVAQTMIEQSIAAGHLDSI